jgi:hypothetical protein
MPEFEDLPFFERPDLSPYLVHLTKNTRADDDYSAHNNLVSILMSGKIFGSEKKKGFIKGPNSATCFMDVPFYSLKYILNGENSVPSIRVMRLLGFLLRRNTLIAWGAGQFSTCLTWKQRS